MRHTTRALLPVLLLLLSLSPVLAQTFTGKVVGISDGDTIRVLKDGREVKVRLNGVDCPESHQAYGTKARQFTSTMVFGKVVSVVTRDTDRYGRTVADVSLAEATKPTMLNRELVRVGLAWWYKRYAPNDKILSALEAEARKAKRGLWADPNPVAPWDFRRGGSTARSGGARTTASRPSSITFKRAPSVTLPRTAGVYITNTGTKYHNAGCRHLRRSQIGISLKDAEAQGYTPCKHCH